MFRNDRGAVVWFFASLGGGIPLAFLIMHLVRRDSLGREDVLLWPASCFLLHRTMTTFTDGALLVAAYFANIVWYMVLGWLVSVVLSTRNR